MISTPVSVLEQYRMSLLSSGNTPLDVSIAHIPQLRHIDMRICEQKEIFSEQQDDHRHLHHRCRFHFQSHHHHRRRRRHRHRPYLPHINHQVVIIVIINIFLIAIVTFTFISIYIPQTFISIYLTSKSSFLQIHILYILNQVCLNHKLTKSFYQMK